MPRINATLALIAVLTAVSACATQPRSPEGVGLAWAPRPKTNIVSQHRYVHPVHFAPDAIRPAEPEIASLAVFLTKNDVRPDDEIAVEGGSAPERLSVARALARLGLPGATDVRFGPEHSTATVLVVVERYLVTPPKCPDWSKPISADFSETVDSNYGCADAYDLGQLVADPHDLLQGRSLGPGNAAAGVLSVERYEQGQVQLGAPSTSGGAGLSLSQAPSTSSSGGNGTQ